MGVCELTAVEEDPFPSLLGTSTSSEPRPHVHPGPCRCLLTPTSPKSPPLPPLHSLVPSPALLSLPPPLCGNHPAHVTADRHFFCDVSRIFSSPYLSFPVASWILGNIPSFPLDTICSPDGSLVLASLFLLCLLRLLFLSSPTSQASLDPLAVLAQDKEAAAGSEL